MPEPAAPSADVTAPEAGPPAAGGPADRVVTGLTLVMLLVLTLALTVWGAFLVPLRVGTVPLPLWAVVLAVQGYVGLVMAGLVGWGGALAAAVVWSGVAWLQLGAKRTEGDLVVPGTVSGYCFLLGGLVMWAAVVVVARSRDDAAARVRLGLHPKG